MNDVIDVPGGVHQSPAQQPSPVKDMVFEDNVYCYLDDRLPPKKLSDKESQREIMVNIKKRRFADNWIGVNGRGTGSQLRQQSSMSKKQSSNAHNSPNSRPSPNFNQKNPFYRE